MVLYSSVTADLSDVCIEELHGSIPVKILSLQAKLQKSYPDVIVHSANIDDEEIIQVKGGWDDIKNLHLFLESWLNSASEGNISPLKADPELECQNVELNSSKKSGHSKGSSTRKENREYGESATVPIITIKPTRSKPRRKGSPRKAAIRVKEEPEELVETSTVADDVLNVVKEISEKFKSECDNSDSDTIEGDLDFSDENDDETDKDDTWVVKKPRKVRKRRFVEEKGNLIDPATIDDVVLECYEKSRRESEKDDKLEATLQCTLCDYKTLKRRLLRFHILRCHSIHTKNCPVCDATFALNKDLKSHMKNHQPKIPCSLCKCKFVRQRALDNHMTQCHGENIVKPKPSQVKVDKQALFKCDQCGYITENRRYLKHHVLRNHTEREHTCTVCNKKFGLEKDLRQHMKNHTSANHVQCEECGKTLRSKFALHLHINSIHRGIKNMYRKEYVCDHCGKLCANKTIYNDHINKDHLSIKRFGCPICPMTFFTKYNLRHHLVTHSDQKNFSCETCGKDFKRSSSLRIHQRIHQSEKLYTCSSCSKSFHQQGALKRHERIHTGEKPYKCFLCSAAFTDYSILRRHLMGIHKQDKDSSRVFLRRAKSIEGINRGGEKRDTVTVDDISIYRGNFRKVEEHVPLPDEPSESPLSKESENSSQPHDLAIQKEAQSKGTFNSNQPTRLPDVNEASMDFTGHTPARIEPQSPGESTSQRPLSAMEMASHMTAPMQSICTSVARQLAPWVIDGRPGMGYNHPIPPTELLNTLCAAEAMAYNQPHGQPHRSDVFQPSTNTVSAATAAHMEPNQQKPYDGQPPMGEGKLYQTDPYYYSNHSVN